MNETVKILLLLFYKKVDSIQFFNHFMLSFVTNIMIKIS